MGSGVCFCTILLPYSNPEIPFSLRESEVIGTKWNHNFPPFRPNLCKFYIIVSLAMHHKLVLSNSPVPD